MKKFLVILMSVFFIAGLFSVVIPTNADAVPSFARQTEQPCLACHYQYIPKLGPMGRAFKSGGLTDASVDLIEGMSPLITAFSTVSIITKFRYINQDSATAGAADAMEERGLWEFWDELAPWFAGRLADNWGYMVEFDANGKIIYSNTIGESVNVSASAFWSDGFGPLIGMELWNTNAVNNARMFENKAYTSVAAAAGWLTEATGFGFHANNDLLYAYVSAWAPAVGKGATDNNFDFSFGYRVAVTPTVGDWDLMVGVYGASGESQFGNSAKTETSLTAIDAQAQGAFGDVSAEFTATYLIDTGSASATNTVAYNTDADGFNVGASLGFAGDKFGAKVAYLDYDDSTISSWHATTIGGWINFADNITLHPEYTFFGGDGKTLDNEFKLLLMWGI